MFDLLRALAAARSSSLISGGGLNSCGGLASAAPPTNALHRRRPRAKAEARMTAERTTPCAGRHGRLGAYTDAQGPGGHRQCLHLPGVAPGLALPGPVAALAA